MPYRPGLIVLFLGLPGLIGCLPSQQAPAKGDLRATDTAGRVPALVQAADQQDSQTLSELVRGLMDEDPAVRLFAIQALNRRTGQTLGYRYYESEDRRRAAAKRWRDWLEGQSAPATSATTDSPGNPNATTR